MSYNEQSIAVREMLRTEGWEIIRKELEDIKQVHERDIRNITSQQVETIGTEYLILKSKIEGIQKVFDIIQSHE